MSIHKTCRHFSLNYVPESVVSDPIDDIMQGLVARRCLINMSGRHEYGSSQLLFAASKAVSIRNHAGAFRPITYRKVSSLVILSTLCGDWWDEIGLKMFEIPLHGKPRGAIAWFWKSIGGGSKIWCETQGCYEKSTIKLAL